jgi:protocatechuate 3,4-dioxygenase beta subunit
MLALPPAALAQSQITTGTIQGTVLDPTGAVVNGAKVEVKNLDTNFTKSIESDSDGRFVFLQLQPGRYTLTVTKQGFAIVIQENLSL